MIKNHIRKSQVVDSFFLFIVVARSVAVAKEGLLADGKVIIFLTRWCEIVCLFSMQKCCMDLMLILAFSILNRKVLHAFFICSDDFETPNKQCCVHNSDYSE